ncbi:hypothetical protein KXD40_004086 [Peronospora effusa]|nr:hypothetical protein KXD40_004086 [Peronospora effusa]
MGVTRSYRERQSKDMDLQIAATPRLNDSDDEEEDSLCSYEPIDLLQDAGINTIDIAKLKNGGFATIGQLFQVSQRKLLDVKGISESKMDKAERYCIVIRGKPNTFKHAVSCANTNLLLQLMPEKSGFVSANTLYLQSLRKVFITTGSKQFDQILGGGLETMSVTEVGKQYFHRRVSKSNGKNVHGEFRTGKTQLCHTVTFSLMTKTEQKLLTACALRDSAITPFTRWRGWYELWYVNISTQNLELFNYAYLIRKSRFCRHGRNISAESRRRDCKGTIQPGKVLPRSWLRTAFHDPQDVLDNIIVARFFSRVKVYCVKNFSHVIAGLIATMLRWISSLNLALFLRCRNICRLTCFASQDPDQGPFRLLIIDSVTALFRSDFSGKIQIESLRWLITFTMYRVELSERQQRLNQHLVRLVKHAEEFNIAVLVVNQVMADPGANVMFGSAIKPVAFRGFGIDTYVLFCSKIIDSPCMPEAECSIQLYTGGITDSSD